MQVLVTSAGAYPLLALCDRDLVRQCVISTYTASGPGGQKRNRTYSAVRITHADTSLTTLAEESRSQAENRARALRRLRRLLAFRVRYEGWKPACMFPDVRYLFAAGAVGAISTRNRLYPMFCATLLDALYAFEGSVSRASDALQVSTAQYCKALARDKNLFAAANSIRQFFSLQPLSGR